MAWYPGAIRKPIARKERGAMRKPVRVNLHVAVSETTSLFSFFNRGGNPDSHFYVRKDGTIEQYVDTAQTAWCDLQGNPDTISIETQGGVKNAQGEPWTAAQVESLAQLYAWAVREHGIALKLATNSKPGKSSHGLSWHRLGINGNFPSAPLHGRVAGGLLYSRAGGKVCPGNAKIRQIPDIFARAQSLLKGGASSPATGPAARPVEEIQLFLAVLGHYDAGDDLQWLDGDLGPATRAAITSYQRSAGLLTDGWWGPNTDTHFERHDLSKIINQIAEAVWNTPVRLTGSSADVFGETFRPAALLGYAGRGGFTANEATVRAVGDLIGASEERVIAAIAKANAEAEKEGTSPDPR